MPSGDDQLEGAFAALGSQAEVILDISNDEHDAGRPRPIDVKNLLVHVIPSLTRLSGASGAITTKIFGLVI